MSGATVAALRATVNAVAEALANQLDAELVFHAQASQNLEAAQTLVANGDLPGVVAGIGLSALEARRRATGETMPDLEALAQRKHRSEYRINELEKLIAIHRDLSYSFVGAVPDPAVDRDLLL